MARYSCILVVVVMIICAAEKVASIRSAGGAAQYKVVDQAGGARHDKGEGARPGATWEQAKGKKATWKQAIDCSPCEEVYVVRDEGETLQTISEKCHAPFILLDNPHVQDTDDISTGSVLLISSTHLPC